MHDINHMTAGESASGANAAEEEEQARQIALSLNNLANASIQKNSTIDSLVATNAQLMQALADIQIAMAGMIPPDIPHCTWVQSQDGEPFLCPLRPHRQHLLLQRWLSSVSALLTGALSSQTGTR
jgi:hypothetical protein